MLPLIPKALAQGQRRMILPTRFTLDYLTAVTKLLSFLAVSAVSVCTILFLVGAVFMVASAGKPERVDKGKKLMTGSLIGLALVLGSYTILRTVIYLIYY